MKAFLIPIVFLLVGGVALGQTQKTTPMGTPTQKMEPMATPTQKMTPMGDPTQKGYGATQKGTASTGQWVFMDNQLLALIEQFKAADRQDCQPVRNFVKTRIKDCLADKIAELIADRLPDFNLPLPIPGNGGGPLPIGYQQAPQQQRPAGLFSRARQRRAARRSVTVQAPATRVQVNAVPNSDVAHAFNRGLLPVPAGNPLPAPPDMR